MTRKAQKAQKTEATGLITTWAVLAAIATLLFLSGSAQAWGGIDWWGLYCGGW